MNNQRWFKPVRVFISLCFLLGFIFLFSDIKAKLPSKYYLFFGYFQFLPSLLKFLGTISLLATGFILVIILTSFFGRVYCSTFCPLGVLLDVMGFLRNKIQGKKARYKYTKPLNLWRYGILGLFVISLLFSGILAINLLDPYANFGRIASSVYQPIFIASSNFFSKILSFIGIYSLQPLTQNVFHANIFIFAILFFLLLAIMVYYRGRLYCNSICPVGSILGLLSKISFFRIKIDNTGCIRCGKCQVVCKANCINIKEMNVDESRCIACYNCILSCESSSIGYKLAFRKKVSTISAQEVSSKRKFIKAGLLYLSSVPLLTKAIATDNTNFETRGNACPPGSIGIDHLKDKCIACQLCISSCPGKVLQTSFLQYGFIGMMLPFMDYNTGFCNYECTKCGEICPSGAILPLTKKEKKTTQVGIVKFVSEDCVVVTKNKSCGSCSEHCPTQAVHMIPYKGTLTIPETNPDICIGCGACEHVCPAEPRLAIYVVANNKHKLAKEPVSEKMEVKATEEFPF
jgi:ferredoxin